MVVTWEALGIRGTGRAVPSIVLGQQGSCCPRWAQIGQDLTGRSQGPPALPCKIPLKFKKAQPPSSRFQPSRCSTKVCRLQRAPPLSPEERADASELGNQTKANDNHHPPHHCKNIS